MNRPDRPNLAAADDLTSVADIDIDSVVRELWDRRMQSPIIRPSMANDVAALIDDEFPTDGESLDGLVNQILQASQKYPRRNTHPGFFGWIAPSGLPSDPLAHAMASTLNENVVGYWASPLGSTIEKSVIRWLADLIDFPPQCEGLLLSGGSMANLSGIGAALARELGPDYRRHGLSAGVDQGNSIIICSRETHMSIRRAAVILGLGTDRVVALDTDDQFRMSVGALEQTLKQHKNVVCVVASAGTTNTGAIDPLESIAELCRRHDVWMHVDAAYGAGGLMSTELKPRYRGIERADSVVMDLHKWFFQSLDGSLLLYRDANWARQLFSDDSDYLPTSENATPEEYRFFDIGPELTRRSRALPVYLSMRCYGMTRLGRNALHNVQCAEYLAELILAHDDLELVVAPQLSILCFRYRPAGMPGDEVDRINSEIRAQIQLEGDYLMSATEVDRRPVLRVCIVNHATRAEHVEGLLQSVLRIGHNLAR